MIQIQMSILFFEEDPNVNMSFTLIKTFRKKVNMTENSTWTKVTITLAKIPV